MADRTSGAGKGEPGASALIDARIGDLADWRGAALARVRALVREAEPGIVEDVKWRKPTNPAGVPCWSCHGLVLTGETYRDKVKLTFARGAAIADPAGLFNASLDGKVRRAIDITADTRLDEAALKALIERAVALNRQG